MPEIPDLNKIMNNFEKYISFSEKEEYILPETEEVDLNKYDYSHFSKNELVNKAVELYQNNVSKKVSEEELAASWVYLAAIFEYKDFKDIDHDQEIKESYEPSFTENAHLCYSALNIIINCCSTEEQKKIQEIRKDLIEKFGKIKPPC